MHASEELKLLSLKMHKAITRFWLGKLCHTQKIKWTQIKCANLKVSCLLPCASSLPFEMTLTFPLFTLNVVCWKKEFLITRLFYTSSKISIILKYVYHLQIYVCNTGLYNYIIENTFIYSFHFIGWHAHVKNDDGINW